MLCDSSQLSKKISNIEEKMSLINILTCKICSEKVRNAHLCPNCSKFFCQNCIKTWLRANTCCPSCIANISQSSLVNCQKLSDELTNALDNINQSQITQSLQCEEHNQGMAYFCSDCCESVCSDCIILSSKHSGHKFSKTKEAKMQFNERIVEVLNKVQNFRKESLKKREEYLGLKLRQNQRSSLKKEEIRKQSGKIERGYDAYFSQNTQYLEGKLNSLKTIIAVGHKSFQHFKNMLENLSKPKLIMLPHSEMEVKIHESCEKILNSENPLNNLGRSSSHPTSSNINPPWHTTEFTVDNFSKLIQKDEIFYTDTFQIDYLEWRLKICPNGKTQQRGEDSEFPEVQDNYLSIYLQFFSGLRNGVTYKHIIDIVHPLDPSKQISQTTESRFDIGACWGYDHFASIPHLYNSQFINKSNELRIRVSITSASYNQLCIDMNGLIKQRQQLQILNQRKINHLREQLNKSQGNHQFMYVTVQQPVSKSSILKSEADQYTIEPLMAEANNDYKCVLKNEEVLCTQKSGQLDFQEYVLVRGMNRQQNRGDREQPDYQSNQLRKAYKRLKRSEQKNLLVF